jgi:hypothetical protein
LAETLVPNVIPLFAGPAGGWALTATNAPIAIASEKSFFMIERYLRSKIMV